MKKSELLRALQTEIRRHTFDTFVDSPPSIAQGGNGVVTPGCPACRKRLFTMNNFMDHCVRMYSLRWWTGFPQAEIMRAILPRIQPIAPKRIQVPFDHAEFVYEFKMDGWRCLAYSEIEPFTGISVPSSSGTLLQPLTIFCLSRSLQSAV